MLYLKLCVINYQTYPVEWLSSFLFPCSEFKGVLSLEIQNNLCPNFSLVLCLGSNTVALDARKPINISTMKLVFE